MTVTGCQSPRSPRTVDVPGSNPPRSAAPERSAAEWRALDEAAVAQLRGGFRTRINGGGAAVVETVVGETVLLHTLLLGEPAVSARWFGEGWSAAPERLRAVAADGTVRESAAPPGTPWRVRLSGPAGFPLGDFAGSWAHGFAGPSFTGRSAGGVRLPPVPGGGGGAWLPSATLWVEPVVGRWWIEDADRREVWSRSSLPASVEAVEPEHPAFWSALAAGIDRRLAAGSVRVTSSPWAAAFGAAGAEDPEVAAERVLAAVLRRK